jgi:hypothetical protein
MACYINPRLGFEAWSNYSETNQLSLLKLPTGSEKILIFKEDAHFLFSAGRVGVRG